MIPEELFQDRNHDGIVDYLNARIYIDDVSNASEIAAAANVAARLAFEAQSVDLPVGFPISMYNSTDESVAVVIGSAAKRFSCDFDLEWSVIRDGLRTVLAIPGVADAERFALTLGSKPPLTNDPSNMAPPIPDTWSLSKLFTFEGLLRGTSGERFPDAAATAVRIEPEVRAVEVINLAARIALESAALRLPLVSIESAQKTPALSDTFLVGRRLPFAEYDSLPGNGRIQIIDLEDGRRSVCISGSDPDGEAAALNHASLRLPFVWDYGKENLHLSTVEEDLHAFFELRSPSGQTAAVLKTAHELIRDLSVLDRGSARLILHADTGDCDFEAMANRMFPTLKVRAENLNLLKCPVVFEDSFEFPWEVDQGRGYISEHVIPKVQNGSAIEIELRVSESQEIRKSVADEIYHQVLRCGADPAKTVIRVLSAYKQAYCWIDEALKPRLRNAHRIRIQYRKISTKTAAPLESSERWLHELYPIDEVLSRDLGIPHDRITFHETAFNSASTYEVFADDNSGKCILHETFDPKFTVRPMFTAFPEYAQVRVGTGWLCAAVDGEKVADLRIETDPEKFWDRYQSETLPKIRDYVLQLHRSANPAVSGPHFGSIEVHVWLSEPDYRIGIDEERISTLEALHEDIYFETLLFLDLLGLKNSGRIIPRVSPSREGKHGGAHIRFTGKTAPNPRAQLSWMDSSGIEHLRTIDVFPRQIPKPRIHGLTVQTGHASVVSIDAAGIELNEENLSLFETINSIHRFGVGPDWLSYEGIDSIRLGSVTIGGGTSCFRQPKIEPLFSETKPVVQSNYPIGPAECERIIQHLAIFPEIRPFYSGRSFLGRSIWAMDVTSPMPGKYVSQAKVSLSKPVLFITGRQHANEVSSTTHILKFAEMLATDVDTRALLDRVNFILQPITNPDGAALVEELHVDTPDFMLHAGYMGSLGTDVTVEQWSDNPLYPEAKVRPRLWRMWLPDVVLNPHGYPSHEWVQLFAGYTAWVKSRDVTARDWWIPRGWFIPSYQYMPETQSVSNDLYARAVIQMQNFLNSKGSWHERMRRRFAKYGLVSIQQTPHASRPNHEGFTFAQRYPQITWLEMVSEAPDEVAQGRWLDSLVDTGLQFSLFVSKFLADNSSKSERTVTYCRNMTLLRIARRRP